MKKDIFVVDKGEPLRSVAVRLKEKNQVKNNLFFIYLAIAERRATVPAGQSERNNNPIEIKYLAIHNCIK